MALPITVPYTFGNATTAIPLSNLDSDYATVYQAVNGIGNGSVALANVAITGGTISGNTTASNVTVSSGTFTNVTLSNVTISSVSTPITAAEGGTGSSSAFTTNGVVYASSTSALATGSALKFDGTNLGLGVTPSAWGSGYTAFQTKNTAIFTSGTTDLNFGQNVYINSGGNYTYISNGYATLYNQYAGKHYWSTAASNTAGNAITFTQAMTLDASGNLGIGTTSPAYKLDVNGEINLADNQGLRSAGALLLRRNATSHEIRVGSGDTSDYLALYTGGFLGATLDSSGNLLVGKTTSAATSVGWQGGQLGEFYVTKSTSTSADATYYLYSTGAGAYRFYVDMGGTVHATSIVITAISDQRLKENVRDIDVGLDAIMALQPRRFDWKEGKGQDKKNAAGFIAQEFETVFPECVSTSKAGEDGIEYKSINHETLIPTLVKAIQELSAQVTSLTTRLTALENK